MHSYVSSSPLIHTMLIVYVLGECDSEIQSLDEGCVSDWRLIQNGKMNLFKPSVLISHTPTLTYTSVPSLAFNHFKKWLTSAFGKLLVFIIDFGNSGRKEKKKNKEQQKFLIP